MQLVTDVVPYSPFIIPILLVLGATIRFIYKEVALKQTGRGTTLARALTMYETLPNIRRDYLASSFLPLPAQFLLKSRLMRKFFKKQTAGLYGFIAIRTIFFDEVMKKELDNVQQIVILGAGMDSRALRFESELIKRKINVFELDLPTFSALKKQKIQQNGKVPSYLKLLPIDFSKQALQDVLSLKNKYDPSKRTLFIWEGVTYYLPQSAVGSTLAFVASNPGNLIAWDYVYEKLKNNPEKCYKGKETLYHLKMLREPFLFYLDPNNVKEFAASRGFKLVKHYPYEKATRLVGSGSWVAQNKPVDWFGLVEMEAV